MHPAWQNAYTIDEFLEELAFSDEKLEFLHGRIARFAGGSVAHAALCARLASLFDRACQPECHVFTSDLAIAIATDAYVFPDLSYSCESIDIRATTLQAPTVVVEVISPQSGRRDRIEKLDSYRKSRSIHEYLLVDSLGVDVTLFTRGTDGELVPRHFREREALVVLSSLPLEFQLAELYAGILR